MEALWPRLAEVAEPSGPVLPSDSLLPSIYRVDVVEGKEAQEDETNLF